MGCSGSAVFGRLRVRVVGVFGGNWEFKEVGMGYLGV